MTQVISDFLSLHRMQQDFCRDLYIKLGENILIFFNLAVWQWYLQMSTSVTNTINDNRQVSQTFTIKYYFHLYYTKSLWNLFLGRQIWHKLLRELLGTVTPNPSLPVTKVSAVGTSPILEPHPPPPLFERNRHPWLWWNNGQMNLLLR